MLVVCGLLLIITTIVRISTATTIVGITTIAITVVVSVARTWRRIVVRDVGRVVVDNRSTSDNLCFRLFGLCCRHDRSRSQGWSLSWNRSGYGKENYHSRFLHSVVTARIKQFATPLKQGLFCCVIQPGQTVLRVLVVTPTRWAVQELILLCHIWRLGITNPRKVRRGLFGRYCRIAQIKSSPMIRSACCVRLRHCWH